MEKAPSTFKVDEHLNQVFQALGYVDINDVSNQAPDETKAVRNLLATIGLKDWDKAYRGALIKPLMIHSTLVDTITKRTAISDVMAATSFLSQYDTVPTDLEEISFDTITASLSHDHDKPSSSKIKPGEIPAFTGKDDAWPMWKEKALAQLKIDGLIKVITDPDYARLHPVPNTIVHGMLTKALIKEEGYGHFPCLLDNVDNGYKAWKTICEYYEHPLLIRNTLKELSKKLNALNLTNISEWETFILLDQELHDSIPGESYSA